MRRKVPWVAPRLGVVRVGSETGGGKVEVSGEMGGGGRALRDSPPCLAVKTAQTGWGTRVLCGPREASRDHA
jgi:hypothetical protein